MTNTLTSKFNITSELILIRSIEDRSDKHIKRMRITFTNGLILSIIQWEHTYGGHQSLFEIAIIDSEGHWCPELYDEDDQGDDILGYCSVEKVKHYINKIGKHDPSIKGIS